MARPPAARTKVLDAYISLLCEEGERAATLEAAATRAGVSKGGLLYHFASKEALAAGVIESTEEHVQLDLDRMHEAAEGASVYYVQTSAEVDTELDRHLVAVQRLAQAGVGSAAAMLEDVHARWLQLILDEVGDPAIAHLVILIGEGLYAHLAMPGSWYQSNFEGRLKELLELVPQLKKLKELNE
ncbi:TetR/AcrR family transcriptional regulator [Arthrobacter sp. MYb211]|uniref:TetR/AcrR family transcriptional regulator n=1 Tax=Micrococcaceae TaxID=1268 RepID=UPI000BB82099|nr:MULTISPECIES: TetR/AcrR family transcriptional regulator [Micrococcaceae]PCC28435.1 TetR family transcriptional regulator [Glutamicibacter sp. BW80]PQZ96867.1 TetR/AcrR family transcriptional regulator [Arthrobacter sp. MYb224]PQZ98001.1 TetR/AcrR family transcriptional regulator [Arthrobacter sp. MYb229]PRA10070.1 TetR/AcrR family transcriptional regulator [Arthrobacter sp. MYb221]PRB46883.1 TetR/AcrR family transcriptional regulator [Arthrobacter sp. MYb216]